MAIPSQPTLDSIVTTALNRGGNGSPSAAEIAEAKDWIEEVKNEIASETAWIVLEAYKTATIPVSQQSYPVPIDFSSFIEASIVGGDDLPRKHINRVNELTSNTGTPKTISIFRGEVYLDPIPNEATEISMKYYLDIKKVDLTSTKHDDILREWRTALIAGVYMLSIQNQEDAAYKSAFGFYQNAIAKLVSENVKKWDVEEIRIDPAVNGLSTGGDDVYVT